jgi:hypothetical protein
LEQLADVDISKFNIPSFKAFAEEKLGVKIPKGSGPTGEYLVAKCGKSKDQVKKVRKELDLIRAACLEGGRNVNLLYAGSRNHSVRMKFRRNKKGQILADTAYRLNTGVSAATIEALVRDLAKANEQIAALTAAPAEAITV